MISERNRNEGWREVKSLSILMAVFQLMGVV